MARLTDATPLIAVEAIAFDSETTGLDTKSARIVQLGAIGLKAGRIEESDAFNRLVNPGVPIPSTATAI
ncbi:MAG: 3'-5' exonuclease, partial [Oricola sp.]